MFSTLRCRERKARKDAASGKDKDKMHAEEVSGYLSETLSDSVKFGAARQYRRAEIELKRPISRGTE